MLNCQIQHCTFINNYTSSCSYCNLWNCAGGYYDLTFNFYIDKNSKSIISNQVRICFLCHENNCPCCSDDNGLKEGIFDLELVKVVNYGKVLSKIKCTSCNTRCGKYEGDIASCFCYSYRFLNSIQRHYLTHICIYYCSECKDNIGQRDIDIVNMDDNLLEYMNKINHDTTIDWEQDFSNIMTQLGIDSNSDSE
jgi:hypothetical protein